MNLFLFFEQHPKAAVAFSGGVDSAYLLYAASQCKAEVKAYYVKTAFQPQFELDDAIRLVKELNIPMQVLTPDVLSSEAVVSNPDDRCYHCKRIIFEEIQKAAEKDGFTTILDGTNASDDAGIAPVCGHFGSYLYCLHYGSAVSQKMRYGSFLVRLACLPGINPLMPASQHGFRQEKESQKKN